MKPQRPYLLRALYEWLVDSEGIPYVLVDATVPDVRVPQEHVQSGQIVLNIGPDAVRDLIVEQDYVMCSSRFGGRPFELYLPMLSIRAIYGRDTRQGMAFPDEEGQLTEQLSESAAADKNEEADGASKPTLRLV